MEDDLTIRLEEHQKPHSTGADVRAATGGGGMEEKGEMIGPYRLIEILGEGGFGIVWRAEQTQPVHRIVALKVIKPGMDSREVIARFEAERQALAMMDHPNIASMFDGGTTPNGRPYFAMEFVKGVPVTAFCDGHKLSLEERIGIFMDVCSAVQHAHQKAILHRDLKPTNILVSEVNGRPVPKVIDFGVAKALGSQLTDKTLVTMLGLTVGTPQYMSPEQAGVQNQDVDTRSDVYSLGVILYELLTGSTPLKKEDLRKMVFSQVQEFFLNREPERPSTRLQRLEQATQQQVAQQRQIDSARLQRRLRGDLDWVVMRALDKDRNRRYQTVNALALDLRRYLNGDAVEAGPPSARYRLGKLAKRYRGALLAASLVLLSILAGLGFTIWQAVRATRAEKLASLRLVEAQGARDAAEKLTTEAILGLRKKLLALGKIEIMEDMVAAADDYYKQLPASLRTDESDHHRGSLYTNRMMIAAALGHDKEHEEYSNKALAVIETLIAKQPDNEALQEEAAFVSLGRCYLFLERNDATQITRTGDQVITRCAAWLKLHPKSAWAFHDQVLAHSLVGQTLVRSFNKPLDGMIRFQVAAQLTKQFRAACGETAGVCECEGLLHYGNATIAEIMHNDAGSTPEYEASVKSFERAIELGGDSALLRSMYSGALLNGGKAVRRQAKSKSSVEEEKRGAAMIQKGHELREKLVEQEPAHAVWWRELAWSHAGLAELAAEKSDTADEVHHLQEAVLCRDEACKLQPNRALFAYEQSATRFALAGALLKQTPPDIQAAADLSLRALEGWRRAIELEDMNMSKDYQLRYDVSRIVRIAASERPEDALAFLISARSILDPLLGKIQRKNDVASSLAQLIAAQGETLIALGRTDEAAEMKLALEKITSEKGGYTQGRLDVARLLIDSASAQLDAVGKLPPAQQPAQLSQIEADINKARTQLEAVVQKDSSPDNRALLAAAWKTQARLLKAQQKKPDAAAAYEKAISLLDPKLQMAPHADVVFDLAELLRDMHDYPAAKMQYEAAVKERDAAALAGPPNGGSFQRAWQAWSSLGSVQQSLGEFDAAKTSYEAALKQQRRAYELEPAKMDFHWNVVNALLGRVKILALEKTASQAADSLNEIAGHLEKLLPAENVASRISSVNDNISDCFVKLRDAGGFNEAEKLLLQIISIRQRMESLKGWPDDPSKSSIGAMISRASLLQDQKKEAESAAAIAEALDAAGRSARPDLITEANSRARSYYDALGKYEVAERHGRTAYEVTKKSDLGHRAISITGDYITTLVRLHKFAEAEKIALSTWDTASTRTWPGEPVKLRSDLAWKISDLYRQWSFAEPDDTHRNEARQWRARQADALPLDAKLGDYDLSQAIIVWMWRMAAWIEEGKLDDYKRVRTRLLQITESRPQIETMERAAKIALLLPATGDELVKAAKFADEAFKKVTPASTNYEWYCISQSLALIRQNKAQEALAVLEPVLKSTANERWVTGRILAAMAHQQLRTPDSAAALLGEIDHNESRSKWFLNDSTGQDSAVARVLLNEARHLATQ